MLNWKRTGSLLASLGLVVTLVLGCSSAPVSQPAAKDAAKDVAKDDIKPVELKLHFQDPLTGPMGKGFDAWAKEVAAKTDGKVKVVLYPSATLGPGPKGLELAKDGVSDISWASIGLYAGRFPLTETLNAPMLGLKNSKQASKIAWELYSSSPDLQKEWETTGTKVIAMMSGGENAIGTAKEIKSLDDFKGLKIRTVGGTPTEFAKQIGAIPAVLPPTEMYQQMEKGVLNAWAIDWQAVQGFKLTEVTNFTYRFNTSFVNSIHVVVINKDAYAKIPEKYKATFDSLCGDYFGQTMALQYDGCVDPTIKAATDNGKKVLFLPADVETKMGVIADGVITNYAKQLDGKGLAGTKTLEQVKALVKKYPQ